MKLPVDTNSGETFAPGDAGRPILKPVPSP